MASTTLCKKEILTDILVRLPAKALVRFLCACKSWSDLISNSSFITTQLNRNVTKHLHASLLCLHYPDLKRPFEFYENYDDYPDLKRELEWSLFSNETFEHCSKLSHPLGIKKNYRVYGSSNGLVCISDDTLDTNSPIHIWNPSVRKFRTLPMSTNHNVKFRYIALQFGFHPGVNDYKVVRMLRVHKDDAFAVEVYSLNTDSWKMVEEHPLWLKCTWQNHRGTFYNGVAYHIIEKFPLFSVMSFDSGSEKFEEFIVPDAIRCWPRLYIEVYKDQICLLYYLRLFHCEEQGMSQIEFWVLQEKRWKQMRPFIYPANNYFVVGFSIDNELLMQRSTYGNALYLCNYESKQDRETGIELAISRNDPEQLLFVFTYIESLILLNC
ncbi:hypothetical protein ACE6H2_009846 [Prunus campanulata]